MSEPIMTLFIRGRPPELHHGSHKERMQRARVQRERRAIVRAFALGERHRHQQRAAVDEIRRLTIIAVWRGPKRDDPNLLQDLKADIDGLVDAGWLVDDDRVWMRLDWPPRYEAAETERDVGIRYELREENASNE